MLQQKTKGEKLRIFKDFFNIWAKLGLLRSSKTFSWTLGMAQTLWESPTLKTVRSGLVIIYLKNTEKENLCYLPIRPIFIPLRASALNADCAPGPGVLVLKKKKKKLVNTVI